MVAPFKMPPAYVLPHLLGSKRVAKEITSKPLDGSTGTLSSEQSVIGDDRAAESVVHANAGNLCGRLPNILHLERRGHDWGPLGRGRLGAELVV